MKNIINVALKAVKSDLLSNKSDLLALGYFSDSNGFDKQLKAVDKALGGAISQVVELGDFTGKDGSSVVVYGNDKIAAKRVMVVGLGEKAKAKDNTLRKAAANAANKAVAVKASKLALGLYSAFAGTIDACRAGELMAQGAYFGGYRYDEFITSNGENGRLAALKVELIDADAAVVKELKKGAKVGAAVGGAQNFARTISNRPGNVINPVTLAAEAKKLARGSKLLSCNVLDKKQMTAKGMGGVLAVGRGSATEPRFIVLKYTSPAKSAAKKPTIGLVGKAITFDSGGISIKPSANMDQMKLDKSGGVAVLSAMKAIADIAPAVNVYGIIPSAENMPSGMSYRPGDIVTTYSGKTVEVQNTDAEGRMILSDGIHYATEQGCDMIVDIATLTGACMVALGRYKAGLMGNDDDLRDMLKAASEKSGENLWPMPSGEEYLDEMKSKIADLKNIGSRWGGACTAAAFLGQFAGDKKWAHIDIAGMDLFEKATAFGAEGSSGYGVRLLTDFVLDAAKK